MPGFQRRGQSKKLEGARSSRMLRGSPAVKDKGRQERVMEKEEEVRAQQREDGAAFIVAAGEREVTSQPPARAPSPNGQR
ncbi:conserved hypothetical protein [Coccidioides posadasii str. Silveira]|uniref:Uncharacterized protein n=1 Tax=Coccidioides posadasii (strain RMSCC 757 / Silveira) TaxID=443226 RepID=E9D1Y9_COCPS|nr:conserved hypothetical protein [Coccidioides posadasii str. Silveira]